MPLDRFAQEGNSLIGPITRLVTVVPSDTTDLPEVTRALYVGVSGTVHVLTAEGNDVTLTALVAGQLHWIRVARVFATGTTATNILAGY